MSYYPPGDQDDKRKYGYPPPPGTGAEPPVPGYGAPPPQQPAYGYQGYPPPSGAPQGYPSYPPQGYDQSYGAPQSYDSGYGSYGGAKKPSSGGNRKIFVSSLAFSVNDASLAKAFEKFGPVVSARVGMDQGKSKGFGFVEFESDESVEKALSAVGLSIENREVKIEPSRESSGGRSSGGGDFRSNFSKDPLPASKTLYVGNLSFSTDKESLRAAFDGFSGLLDTRVVSDRDTGKSRGFGYVEFTDSDSAQIAFDAMRDTEIEGRRVKINFAGERNSVGGGDRGGFGGGRGRGGFSGGRGGFGGGDYDRDSRGGGSDRDRGYSRGGDRDYDSRDSRDSRDSYRDSRDSRSGGDRDYDRSGGDRDRNRGDRDRGSSGRDRDRSY